jgi:hypothetical protein
MLNRRCCGRLQFAFLVLVACALPGRASLAAESPEQQLTQLEAGVQAAEAVRAVKRLQNAYAQFLDAGQWSDLADLFADNGVVKTPGLSPGEVRGKQGLRDYFMHQAGRTEPGLAKGQINTHLVMQPIVTLGPDGHTAKGAWHEMSMLGRVGSTATWAGGVYENDYVLEKGIWKIARVRHFPQYRGAFEDYGHKAPPRWNIPYHFVAAHVGVTIPSESLAALAAAVPSALPEARLADLQLRLARLGDETELRNLQNAYGYYLDRKMWDDLADLFDEGGSLEVVRETGPPIVRSGRAQIRQGLESLHGASPLQRGELFDHLQLDTVVTIAPDGLHAATRTTQLGMSGVSGQFAQWEVGLYENRFVRKGGKWRISAVHFFPRVTTDYDLGWAVDARPATAVNAAFHYANPVTGRSIHSPGRVVQVTRLPGNPAKRGAGWPPAQGGIPALQQQLAAAIAVDAVENLNSSYGYYIDESAWDEMADTFASIGSKEITGAGVYVGPDRIRRILKLRGPLGGRTANFFTIHQLTQPVIHVAADGLSAKARLRLFQAGGNADGSSGSWIGGIYENTAVFENGEWKFGAQDLHHSFNASYRNGWARVGTAAGTPLAGRPASPRDTRGGGITQGLGGAASGPKLSTEYPPDRPIRARQYSFPEIVEPAFHYVNPVSGRVPRELLP